MQIPICVPSAEQIVPPAVVQVPLEVVGADEGCGAALGEAAEGGAAAAEGALELSAGTGAEDAGAEGAAAATFSCTFTDGTAGGGAAAAVAGADGCTADDGLSLPPEPPGTVHPIGVH